VDRRRKTEPRRGGTGSMRLAVIKLLAGRDGHRQPVLLGRDGAGRIRRDRTRRVVGLVEIKNNLAVLNRVGFEEAAGGISIGLAGRIASG